MRACAPSGERISGQELNLPQGHQAGSLTCAGRAQRAQHHAWLSDKMVCAMQAAWHATQQHASMRVIGCCAGNDIANDDMRGERDSVG